MGIHTWLIEGAKTRFLLIGYPDVLDRAKRKSRQPYATLALVLKSLGWNGFELQVAIRLASKA